MPGVVVDVGTGDGSFVYRLARENPDRLFIGIDPNHKGLQKLSLKASKKHQKGGLENVAFVLGSIEDLPEELNGLVNQVFINLPWSGLLEKIVTVETNAWKNLSRICRKGAFIDLLFGYDDSHEEKVKTDRQLPELNLGYIRSEMKQKLSTIGFDIAEAEEISGNILKRYPTVWAKKLSFTPGRKFFYVRVVKR